MPWNSFNTIRNKGKILPTPPSISFSRAVTKTTVNASGTNYNVYDISGSDTTWNETASPITCSIYSESPITIYYLVVGSGGSSSLPGSRDDRNGGGGGGAGGFLEGNFVLLGNTVVKNIGINVGPQSAAGIAGKFSMIDCSFQNITIIAGGGGAGSRSSIGGNAPDVSNGVGILSIKGGGGGGGSYRNSGTVNGGSGAFNGGSGFGTNGTNGGGGGGANSKQNGASGTNTVTGFGAGAASFSVNTTTLGIYQKFPDDTTIKKFCGGGGGGAISSTEAGLTKGIYGSGGGSAGGYVSPGAFSPGLKGLVAIAIRVIDIP